MGHNRQRIGALLSAIAVMTTMLFGGSAAQAQVAASAIHPNDYNGPIAVADLRYDGLTLYATGHTIDWNRGTIYVEAVLYEGTTLEWDYPHTCYNGTSCTVPTTYEICPASGTVWQLYFYADDGTKYISDRKDIIIP